MAIESGNLEKLQVDYPERRGWFVGSFIPDSSLLHSKKCEAKYVHFPKGSRKDSGLDLESDSRTVVILVSGKWNLIFPEENREILLQKPGDFVAFDSIPHESEAFEDCIVFVVRWYV